MSILDSRYGINVVNAQYKGLKAITCMSLCMGANEFVSNTFDP